MAETAFRVLGVDPGLDGGLVFLDGLHVRSYCVMPVVRAGRRRQPDERELCSWLLCLPYTGVDAAFIESVAARPGQGVVSMFSFGTSWGIIRGMLAGMRIPYELVRPQDWQRVMLRGQPAGSEYLVASRLWPDAVWRATPRCTKPHSGLVDAALIAEYGRRRLGGVERRQDDGS